MKTYKGTRATPRHLVTVITDSSSMYKLLPHVVYHSPTGLEWGYAGSGPADLALSILTDYFEESPEAVLASIRSLWVPQTKACRLHQSFKFRFVSQWREDTWKIDSDTIDAWVQEPSIAAAILELERQNADLAESERIAVEATLEENDGEA